MGSQFRLPVIVLHGPVGQPTKTRRGCFKPASGQSKNARGDGQPMDSTRVAEHPAADQPEEQKVTVRVPPVRFSGRCVGEIVGGQREKWSPGRQTGQSAFASALEPPSTLGGTVQIHRSLHHPDTSRVRQRVCIYGVPRRGPARLS